ncbi:hypothetical protein CPB85DRAFT_1448934 [Mucidula mucida]|nr:hypothetical protein CPB85DRAFT_1448934 [Mucidula mucida]
MSLRPLFIVAGVGNATGTGAAAARLFAKSGYSIALVSRSRGGTGHSHHHRHSRERNNSLWRPSRGLHYPILHTRLARVGIRHHRVCIPPNPIRAARRTVERRPPVWKAFLDTTEADLEESMNTNVHAAFAFARHAILGMRGNASDAETVFAGNTHTSAFSAAKSGVRALSQSLAKEFGPKEDIHVAHAIIDGRIMTGSALEQSGGKMNGLRPESIAQAYLNLAQQEKSAWTWELDLRAASEQW